MEMVPQLVDMLKPQGVLAFTFIDPHHHSWHRGDPANNLRWRLEKARRHGVEVDVEKIHAQSHGARWCILINDRELHVETNELPAYALEDQETFHIYYTREYMAELFPGAQILPPVNNEHHHCCILRGRGSE